jgi:hypothetical protein
MVPGDFFCFPPPDSDGFFDSLVNGFSSLVTGAIDAIGAVVNTVAAIWEEIKGVVVNFVADAIGALGIPCDDTCREGITLGLNVGLAALGLPPSLPNFDQLSEQGLDYLVAEAAEQYGVPPEAATAIVHEVVSDMQASHDSGLGPGADWIMLDDGFRHATVVANVSAGPFATLPDDVILISDSIFQASVVPLPKAPLASGKTLLVPMVLPIDLTGLAEPPSVTFFGITTYLVDVASWYRNQWFVKQLGACVHSQVFALKTDPVLGIPMPQSRMAAFGFNTFLPANLANGTTSCP